MQEQLHSIQHCLHYMSSPTGFRVGSETSETVVASENDRNNFEMQKVNTQIRMWLGYES